MKQKLEFDEKEIKELLTEALNRKEYSVKGIEFHYDRGENQMDPGTGLSAEIEVEDINRRAE